jgi:histidyl-tRNA synthetase
MDFDIIGNSEENIYDFEMIDTLCDTMDKLVGLNNVTIKINHRGIVSALLDYAMIPINLRQAVCSILDRLDKVKFLDVQAELISIVGDESTGLLNIAYENTSFETICKLLNLNENILCCMNQLFKFKPCLIFDPFLIRGMDYYTGIIFEVGYVNKEIMPFTISAGGRYDNMIGSFGKIPEGNADVPAIGMSLGIERIARILEQTTMKEYKVQMYDIYVATVCKTADESITFEQMKICSELRSEGFKVLTTHIKEQKFKRHLDNVFNNNIKYMVILGDNELKTNSISIKNMESREQITITRSDLVNYFKQVETFYTQL